MDQKKPLIKSSRVIPRLIICAVVLLIGIISMLAMASMKKPPAEARLDERALPVEIRKALTQDMPVFITGYGETRALEVVTISPEVSGRIVAIHPRLKAGETIGKDEILFEIDRRDYLADQREASALVEQWQNTILRLTKQSSIDQARLKTLRRSQRLAEDEFKRLKDLFEKDRVGTRSGVDAAERAANTARDQADQMGQAVTLYPIQIQEARNSLKAAQARQEIASIRLERCVVAAPFTGRVRTETVRQGQFVTAGTPAVTLADDSMLEIHIPIDSRDARRWLRFRSPSTISEAAWFGDLDPVTCRIKWTEALDDRHWNGVLHRVVEFNKETRTVTVAVRVSAAEAVSGAPERIPLVDGMFCLVEIPGKTMNRVVALPRWAVSFEDTVYLVRNNRLKTIEVQVARIQGEHAYISDGLKEGDQVIVTRLVDPLENALVHITNPEATTAPAPDNPS